MADAAIQAMPKSKFGPLCICLLTGCTEPVPSPADGSVSSSAIAASSPSVPDGTAGDDMETEANSNGSEESISTEGLVKYDSVYDIPFIELGIANDGKDLTQNGQMRASTPGIQWNNPFWGDFSRCLVAQLA